MATDERTGTGETAGEEHRQDDRRTGGPQRGAAAQALETLQRLTLLERRVEELRRTRAERDAARAQLARLSASEARYRALVETSPDCIWEVDGKGRFTYLSPTSASSPATRRRPFSAARPSTWLRRTGPAPSAKR